jgi:hypothetical protein
VSETNSGKSDGVRVEAASGVGRCLESGRKAGDGSWSHEEVRFQFFPFP